MRLQRSIAALIAALIAAATLAYPVLIYLGLTRWNIRWLALVVVGVSLVALVARLRGRGGGGARYGKGAVLGVLGVVLLAGLSAASKNATFVLFVPVLISGSLLLTFGVTLRPGSTPLVERFARMQEPNLTTDETRWCRTWTVLWCLFFIVNGLTALTLALVAPAGWWAAYSGGVAYALIGAMVAVEYIARKARFGRLGANPIDRLLARVLPPRTEPRP